MGRLVRTMFFSIVGLLALWALTVQLWRLRKRRPIFLIDEAPRPAAGPALAKTKAAQETDAHTIRVVCSNSSCQQRIQVESVWLGHTLKCPTCGKDIEIPAEDTVPSPGFASRLLAAARARAAAAVQVIPIRKIKRYAAAASIVAAVCLLVHLTANRIRATYNRPPQFLAKLAEISDVGEIRRSPAPNPGASLLWYNRNLESGIGVLQVDLLSMKEDLVYRLPVDAYEGNFIHMAGCSPDGRHLLFSGKQTNRLSRQNLTIVSTETGKFLDELLIDGPTSHFVWLSRRHYVFLDNKNSLYMASFRRDPATDRVYPQRLTLLRKFKRSNRISALAAVDDKTVAYVQGDGLYKLNANHQRPDTLGRFPGMSFRWMTYSPATEEFMLTGRSTTNSVSRSTAYRFKPGPQAEIEPLEKDSHLEWIFNGQWLQGGAGHAYVAARMGGSYLAVRPQKDGQRTNLFVEGYVRAFTVSPDGNKIFAVASIGPEPQEVWEYDLNARSLRPVTETGKKRFEAAEIVTPIRGETIAGREGVVPYYMLPPTQFDPSKRYPLVIDGPTESRWSPHSQFLANAGIYYVSVDRRGLASSDDLTGAARDIHAVYQDLKDRPTIDPKRIFLMGFSASGHPVRELVDKYPDYWRGAVFNGAVTTPRLPETRGAPFPRLLYSMGELEHADNLPKYASAACAKGYLVKVVKHPDGGHMFRNNRLIRERSRVIAEFILREYWY